MPRRKKNIDQDEPTPQKVRAMNVLSCTPGHAHPIDGPPDSPSEEVAMMTIESGGHIEPWMLPLRDAEYAARHLITVLAHFGNETALEIYYRYYGPDA